MLIAFASIVHLVALGSLSLTVFTWLAIAGAWALMIGMLVAAFKGQRGLKPDVSGISDLTYTAYITGSVSSLAAVALLVVGLAGSLG